MERRKEGRAHNNPSPGPPTDDGVGFSAAALILGATAVTAVASTAAASAATSTADVAVADGSVAVAALLGTAETAS